MTKFFLTTSLATLMALPLCAMDHQDHGKSNGDAPISKEKRMERYKMMEERKNAMQEEGKVMSDEHEEMKDQPMSDADQ